MAAVFLAIDMSLKVLEAMLGFAGGVMVLHVALANSGERANDIMERRNGRSESHADPW